VWLDHLLLGRPNPFRNVKEIAITT
jgi:hypothetical protein